MQSYSGDISLTPEEKKKLKKERRMSIANALSTFKRGESREKIIHESPSKESTSDHSSSETESKEGY